MKAFLRAYKTLFLSIALFAVATANANEEPKYEKTKSYSKTYPLSSGEKVSLTNQFGKMDLQTWDKNEIKVDVVIKGKSDDEKRAQEILDKITIEDGKGSGGVWFKTKFAKDQWNDRDDDDDDKKGNSKDKDGRKNHRNEGMEINYTVYMPATNPLLAENQFGPMSIPDYRGEAKLSSKFGSLKAGKIMNAKSVDVEFGHADIAQVNGGKLSIKFSRGSVDKLSGDVDANFEFCDKVKVGIDNDVKGLNVRNSYSTVYLDVDKSFSGNYAITTSFGEFTNKSSFAIKEQGGDKDDDD
ncbi:MAG TPA: hypothetical protein VJT83_04105, partial [Chitinophagaceae bacterium]|nr:hypothetical protein [Chitinophagaceae bacterium]